MNRSIVSVTTPASTHDLTTLAAAKSHLGITDGGQDTQITSWIKQSSAAAATFCGRVFGNDVVTETFRLSRCSDVLRLSRFPVIVLTSVSEDATVLLASEYEFDATTGLVYRLDGDEQTEWSASKIEVQYEGGYDLDSGVPSDLERACLVMISHAYSSGSRDPLAKRIEIPDVETVDYWVGGVGRSGELPSEVVSLLQPYRQQRL